MTLDIKTALAYAASAYLIASIIYLLVSYCCLDTPFKNSLTEEQKQIEVLSASTRSRVFWGGIAIGIVVLWLWKPFLTDHCQNPVK
jgi:hypothetical protein